MKERREVGKKEKERSKKEGKREVVIKVLVSPIGYGPPKYLHDIFWHIFLNLKHSIFFFLIKEKILSFEQNFFVLATFW